ncbi:MAG: hypothetical protein MJZ03_05365, partial [archaeon]|nr:hypothetical protein [archaeon]
TVCTNESQYNTYSSRGRSSSGVYFDTLRTVSGCDSIIELRLTVYQATVTVVDTTICPNSRMYIRGMLIDKSGVYFDTLYSKNGRWNHQCDSVVKYVVNIADNYLTVDSASICSGSSYRWRNRDYSQQGIYFDSLKSEITGCDSVFELKLTIKEIFDSVKYDTVRCQSSYVYRGRTYTQSGTYYEHYVSSIGCDSTYTLNLEITHPSKSNIHFDICQGESFTYRNKVYFDENVLNSDTTFNDTILAANGCDSIVTITINVHPVYSHSVTTHICPGESYNFRGRTVCQAGVYYDRVPNSNGCDDVYKLNLVIDSVYRQILFDTVCTNESHYWSDYYNKGKSTSGTYLDTVKAANGCDSIVELRLKVYQSSITTVDTVICPNSALIIHGNLINTAGVYYDTLLSGNGRFGHQCDSIIKYVVNIADNYMFVDSASICQGESYVWRNRSLHIPGVYYDTLKTGMHCDSIYELVLRYSYSLYNVIDTICAISYTSPNGYTYTHSGVYYDTIMNQGGCFDVTKIILHLIADTTNQVICQGESYMFYGKSYNTTGVYYDSINGIDNIHQLRLTVYPTFQDTVIETICQNDTCQFNKRIYRSSGSFFDSIVYHSVHGCDSIIYLVLNVNPTYEIRESKTICDYDSFQVSQGMVNKTGIYYDSLITYLGCDSVIIIQANVIQTQFFDTVYLCNGDSVYWHGIWRSGSNVFTYTETDTSCNCVKIYHLKIDYTQETVLNKVDDTYMCADDKEFTISVHWTGNTPEYYNITYADGEVGISRDVKDEAYYTNDIIVSVPEPLEPGYYNVDVELYNGNCHHARSKKRIQLEVRYPNTIMNQHWNDVVALYNKEHNGGYNFTEYEWYVNNKKVQGATGSNLYLQSLRVNDEVYVKVRRDQEAYMLPSCPLIIEDLSGLEVSDYPIIVTGSSPYRIVTMVNCEYRLYSLTGQLLKLEKLDADTEIEVDLPYVAGCYLLVIDVDKAGRKVFKVIVN